ncbi:MULTISPECIES: MBL fold metallo-hydrolase [unclassified Spirosoma]|uniref:MBL fold metallo-hydrolase n=1 Tax=unclassified Spirosoma TaxID=2621999 RepID=UPI0009679B00|nr:MULTISPECIES: MBL fold metallo-hydrolase [unclassified Spirosoma]MBN8822544.1 MBL fold metallo-hydrolase [Spirosoma sp.]OJW74042.1 MAG: twin-arginine translocation pathway signal [Spirosoma sp. 48-14]
MYYLLPVLISGLILLVSACAPRYKGPVTDHFDGKKFFNPGMSERGTGSLLKWLLNRDKGPWPDQPDAYVGDRPATRIEGDSLVITFVNHSTFLIQTAGLNILTDPVWSKRVGPTSWLGIKRKRPPGLRFEELPPIDVVLLSHNHYDHLDLPTIKKLVKAHNPLFVTPLGVSHLPKSVDGRTTRELDWNDTLTITEKLRLTCTQAQHFSNRGMGDRDETLWCGYLLHTSFGITYFCGDSGYGPHFKRIAEQAERAGGPIKLALLPIGSYRPEWFMAPVHVSPAGAVQAFIDVKAQQAVGIHFGTFQQGDDGLFEPANDLKKALNEHAIPESKFLVPQEGRPMVFK